MVSIYNQNKCSWSENPSKSNTLLHLIWPRKRPHWKKNYVIYCLMTWQLKHIYAETESTKESHSSCAVLLNYCNIWPSWSQLCYTVDTRECSVIVFHALVKPTGLVNPDTACTALHPRFAAAWITRISILDLTKVTRNMIIISCWLEWCFLLLLLFSNTLQHTNTSYKLGLQNYIALININATWTVITLLIKLFKLNQATVPPWWTATLWGPPPVNSISRTFYPQN